MMEQERADFIESFDVVVRLNKGWKVQDDKKNILENEQTLDIIVEWNKYRMADLGIYLVC